MESLAATKRALETYEVKPGMIVSLEVLRDLLPEPDIALFFGKMYDLDYRQLSRLFVTLFKQGVVQALLANGDVHSHDLQGYVVDVVPPAELMAASVIKWQDTGQVEFLPELFDQLKVELAESIRALAEKLKDSLSLVQGKEGTMLFKSLLVLNKQRGSLGQYKATIVHPSKPKNLVILDDSGSVDSPTVTAIADEVVALAYKADAGLALVSNTTRYWEPGTFSTADVLAAAQYGGTYYETLDQLLNEDWATVVTIADYDSSRSAQQHLAKCTGHIDEVLDISLVNRTSFLAECVGQLADEVRPLLISNSTYVVGSSYAQSDRSAYHSPEGYDAWATSEDEPDDYWPDSQY